MIFWKAVLALGVLVAILQLVPLLTWVERRLSAWIQGRVGPNRVGPFGLFQPLAESSNGTARQRPRIRNAKADSVRSDHLSGTKCFFELGILIISTIYWNLNLHAPNDSTLLLLQE